MIMLAHALPRLIDRLPALRGELTENAPLSGITWFRTGGPAEVLFRPADIDDLTGFCSALDDDIDVTVLGLGSNALIRDGGLPGVTIHLGKAFGDISFDGATVTAGAGALDVAVARAGRDRSIGGLEFLSGIPGTIGGALRMNAGAYGREISEIVVSAQAIDRAGKLHSLQASDFRFTYRHSEIDESWIFVSACLAGTPGDREEIDRRMAEIAADRKSSQPIQARTGGSTFKNPDTAKAWELIDGAGCRGLTIGDATVSEQHCNFLINRGNATAADLEALGEEVRRRVEAHSGISLEWEIRRIGVAAEDRAS
jgi:UDP-N-acetylmuramate dehydrogenase